MYLEIRYARLPILLYRPISYLISQRFFLNSASRGCRRVPGDPKVPGFAHTGRCKSQHFWLPALDPRTKPIKIKLLYHNRWASVSWERWMKVRCFFSSFVAWWSRSYVENKAKKIIVLMFTNVGIKTGKEKKKSSPTLFFVNTHLLVVSAVLVSYRKRRNNNTHTKMWTHLLR